jgi:hypothetical protein
MVLCARKVACVHRRLEILCENREIYPRHKEIRIGL